MARIETARSNIITTVSTKDLKTIAITKITLSLQRKRMEILIPLPWEELRNTNRSMILMRILREFRR
jgi:hypothetical protein